MVILAFHNKNGQGPRHTRSPRMPRAWSHRPSLEGQRPVTSPGELSQARPALETPQHDACSLQHSDTGKGNMKVHLFVSMPSKSTDYSNQDQLEPKQQQQKKHGGQSPPWITSSSSEESACWQAGVLPEKHASRCILVLRHLWSLS